jgi:hypothetical protein
MTRQAAGAVDFSGMEPKRMSTGLREDVRQALRQDDAVGRSHEVARRTLIPPYVAHQLSDGEMLIPVV